MNNLLPLLLIGLASGALAAFLGLGGGVIIVPALVFFLGMAQKNAQGTSIAVLTFPVAFFAAYNYWKQGYVDVDKAVVLAIGFVAASFTVSRFIHLAPDVWLKRGFGLLLAFTAGQMLLDGVPIREVPRSAGLIPWLVGAVLCFVFGARLKRRVGEAPKDPAPGS